jgi:SAM-dependent methyltransferase
MEITNLQKYTDAMKKSIIDKIFFVDKIDTDTIIDYGCADGAMLKFIQDVFTDYNLYGYDISEDMLELAREDGKGIKFYSKWNTLFDKLPDNMTSPTLVLSSIIHEVYSYGSFNDIKTFWNRVFKTGFKYIVLRDMMLSEYSNKESDINDMIKIRNNIDTNRLHDFEQNWGNISENKNLIHYLLKYRYTENWEREVIENYLPITKEYLLSLIPNEYEVVFYEHYTLPFLKNRVKEDFGINLTDKTHIKIILKRR